MYSVFLVKICHQLDMSIYYFVHIFYSFVIVCVSRVPAFNMSGCIECIVYGMHFSSTWRE